jgi:hypothetical protein
MVVRKYDTDRINSLNCKNNNIITECLEHQDKMLASGYVASNFKIVRIFGMMAV